MNTIKAILIDVDYKTLDNGNPVVRVLAKDIRKKRFCYFYDYNFKPYFYLDSQQEIRPQNIGSCSILSVEKVRRIIGRQEKELQKIYCRHPREVPILSNYLNDIGKVYEDRIPFGRRYIIDKRIRPMNLVEIEIKERDGPNMTREYEIISMRDAGETEPELNVLVIDTEVYNPTGMPMERKDPVIIISYADKKHKEGAAIIKDEDGSEAEIIKELCKKIKEEDVEVLAGYNTSAFDLPYLKARAKVNSISLEIGRDGSEPEIERRGMTTRATISGRIHYDVYHAVRFLATVQALKTQRYTLEEVYREMTGKRKKEVDGMRIANLWDNPVSRKELIEYAKSDAAATYEIFERVFPLQIELARLARMPMHDTNSATLGQLVESLLMAHAAENSIVIPNKPLGEDIEGREEEPIAGAYVKMPEPGIYDRIAVLDFRGLYPSLIVSYNLSPDALNCECCRDSGYVSPLGHRFCKRKKGIITEVLDGILKQRAEIKKRLREEPQLLNKSQARKYLSAAFYGMLRYLRARWYSREAAESVTAWGRQYIQEVGRKAEEAGFNVLYQDTDSIFLLMGGKTEQDVREFMNKINSELPESMELELEDFYSRGVFVAKKSREEKGAKKKYALISKDGKIKIRGFELVRRDWSRIARDTQRRVLRTILEQGDKEKAVQIVREVIDRLRKGDVGLDELVIYTQLKKRNYSVTSPELAAAEKARKRGRKIKVGEIIGYVVTRHGRTVSEKAELVEYAKDYDPDYYVNNQILPAVLRILGELGYNEDDIKYLGKQSSLDSFFG
ncbi:MAG: DNA-directed DNA polymerase [Candidatus Micrarchaeia archaeon]